MSEVVSIALIGCRYPWWELSWRVPSSCQLAYPVAALVSFLVLVGLYMAAQNWQSEGFSPAADF